MALPVIDFLPCRSTIRYSTQLYMLFMEQRLKLCRQRVAIKGQESSMFRYLFSSIFTLSIPNFQQHGHIVPHGWIIWFLIQIFTSGPIRSGYAPVYAKLQTPPPLPHPSGILLWCMHGEFEPCLGGMRNQNQWNTQEG